MANITDAIKTLNEQLGTKVTGLSEEGLSEVLLAIAGRLPKPEQKSEVIETTPAQ